LWGVGEKLVFDTSATPAQASPILLTAGQFTARGAGADSGDGGAVGWSSDKHPAHFLADLS
jgi:hypothetical protein